MPWPLTRGQVVAVARLIVALVADAAPSVYNIGEVAASQRPRRFRKLLNHGPT